MDKRDFVKRLYAGIFFIIGVLLILVVVLAIGMEKGITQPKFTINVLYHEVGGLSVGAPVRLSGVNVGTVGRIDFLDEPVANRQVEVVLNVFRRYRRQLEQATRFAIKTEGILGEKLVEITIFEGRPPLDFSQMIIGEDPLDVQGLAETFGDTAESLMETAKLIDSMIEELQNISLTFKRMINRIEESLIDGNLFRLF